MFFDPIYIFVVLLPTIAITGWAAWRVRSAYGKWDRVDSGIDRGPVDFARYAPRSRVLRVSSSVAGRAGAGRNNPLEEALGVPGQPTRRLSVASAAVIAHEVGHALQHAQNDPAMALRQAIVPVAQIGSGIAPCLIIP